MQFFFLQPMGSICRQRPGCYPRRDTTCRQSPRVWCSRCLIPWWALSPPTRPTPGARPPGTPTRGPAAAGRAQDLILLPSRLAGLMYISYPRVDVPIPLSLYDTATQNYWRCGFTLGQSPNAKICVGDTNMLVCKNAKICVTPNANAKICVTPNANPQRGPVEYSSQRTIFALATYISILCVSVSFALGPVFQWNKGIPLNAPLFSRGDTLPVHPALLMALQT